MTTANLLKRLQKLEASTRSKWISFKMADGSKHILPRKRIGQVYNDALYGKTSDETSIVLNAVSDNSGGRMRELLQMVVN